MDDSSSGDDALHGLPIEYSYEVDQRVARRLILDQLRHLAGPIIGGMFLLVMLQVFSGTNPEIVWIAALSLLVFPIVALVQGRRFRVPVRHAQRIDALAISSMVSGASSVVEWAVIRSYAETKHSIWLGGGRSGVRVQIYKPALTDPQLGALRALLETRQVRKVDVRKLTRAE